MASSHWRAKRAEYQANRPWQCGVLTCRRKSGLQLHHLTYARLGREQLDDLIPLCPTHHKEAHRLHGLGVPLRDAHRQVGTVTENGMRKITLPDAMPKPPKPPKRKKTRAARPKAQRRLYKAVGHPRDLVCRECRKEVVSGGIRCSCGGVLETPLEVRKQAVGTKRRKRKSW